jgi:hypothetical protein
VCTICIFHTNEAKLIELKEETENFSVIESILTYHHHLSSNRKAEKLADVVPTCNPRTGKAEAGGSRVQGHCA